MEKFKRYTIIDFMDEYCTTENFIFFLICLVILIICFFLTCMFISASLYYKIIIEIILFICWIISGIWVLKDKK